MQLRASIENVLALRPDPCCAVPRPTDDRAFRKAGGGHYTNILWMAHQGGAKHVTRRDAVFCCHRQLPAEI